MQGHCIVIDDNLTQWAINKIRFSNHKNNMGLGWRWEKDCVGMLKEKINHIEDLSINPKFSFQCQIKTMTYFFLIQIL